MELLALLNDLIAKLADAQAALEAEKKLSYDAGFAAGVASMQVNSEKVYSQAELDAAVVVAVEKAILPYQNEVELFRVQLEDLKANLEAKVQAAVLVFKAELLAKYEAAQAAEAGAEEGFKELLK